MVNPPPPTRPKAEARRQQILDAACACVRRAGFHGASMAEIAQTAGVSVGQIYRYFESKEAIVAAIVGQDLAEMRDKFAELETSGASMVDTVIDGCAHAVDRNYDPDRAALVLEVLAEAARSPRVASIVRGADADERLILRKLFDQACPADCSEAQKAARGEVLCMLFEGMFMRAINNPGGDRAAISEVLQGVLRLLLSSPAPNTANTLGASVA